MHGRVALWMALSVLVAGLTAAAGRPCCAEDSADTVERAAKLIAAKNYQAAAALLEPIASSTRPTLREVTEGLETCYRVGGDPRKAIPLLLSLARDYPNDTPRWMWRLGRCYLAVWDYSQAISAFRQGLEFTPRPHEVTLILTRNLGRAYSQTGKWDELAGLYQSLMEKQPAESVEWQFQLGQCRQAQGNVSEAITCFEKALQLANGDMAGVKRIAPDLCKAYQTAKQVDKAKALLDRLREEHPEDGEFWRSQTDALLCSDPGAKAAIQAAYKMQDRGEYQSARMAFLGVIGSYPQCKGMVESAHICIVECLTSMGEPSEAMAYAKKLYDEKPDMRGGSLFSQGHVSFATKDFNAAAVAFGRVVSEYPKDPLAERSKAMLVFSYRRASRIDEAVDVLRRDFGSERRASAFMQIGRIYYAAARYADAVAAFKEVRSLKDAAPETLAEATYYSGLCYRATKFNDSAWACIRQVVKDYAGSEWAHEAQGQIYNWTAEDATQGQK